MSGPRKELDEIQKGIQDAQEAVKVGIMGLFTSAQDLLKLIKNQQELSREQLQAITSGLDSLHDRYDLLNKNIAQTQANRAVVSGQVPATPQAKKALDSLENSAQKLTAVNEEIKKINQEIAKLPMITGQVPAGVTATQLQAQAEKLQEAANSYYTSVNTMKENLKAGQARKTEPKKTEEAKQAPSARPGKTTS